MIAERRPCGYKAPHPNDATTFGDWVMQFAGVISAFAVIVLMWWSLDDPQSYLTILACIK